MTDDLLELAIQTKMKITELENHVKLLKEVIAQVMEKGYAENSTVQVVPYDNRFSKFTLWKSVLPTDALLTIYLERLEKQLEDTYEKFKNI